MRYIQSPKKRKAPPCMYMYIYKCIDSIMQKQSRNGFCLEGKISPENKSAQFYQGLGLDNAGLKVSYMWDADVWDVKSL